MRGKLIIVSLLLAGTLCACSGRELTNVTLIQTVGVDGAGPVALTAVGDEEDGPARYQTVGQTVTAAQEALKTLGRTRLELTHISQVVLGPEADVPQTLWEQVVHRESGYGATVWLCEDDTTASALLEQSEDPAARLESLRENSGAAAPTVLEALSALTRTGQVRLPVLAADGEDLRVTEYRTVEVGRA